MNYRCPNLEDKNLLVRVEEYNEDYEWEQYFLIKTKKKGYYRVVKWCNGYFKNNHVIYSKLCRKKDIIEMYDTFSGSSHIEASFYCEVLEYFKTRKRHIENWS